MFYKCSNRNCGYWTPSFSTHANMIRKTKLIKSKKHLEWVARNHVCLRCRSNYGIQSTHIRHTDSKGNIGWGIKPCDGMVVPLCYLCHQKQHSMNELKFWIALNINPIYVAKELAHKTTCAKIKQLAKEGYYDEPIKYWDNLQASAKSTLESQNL